jgi:hypothetical protein
MSKYHVNVQEKLDDEYLAKIWFECDADNAEHAKEQAENAYPECKINAVHASINWDTFEYHYKPKTNHLDSNASYGGYMFETYGEELEAVKQAYNTNPATVWTVICDSGNVDVSSGFHFCNRLGYIITEIPADCTTDVINEDYNEILEYYDYECPNCHESIEGNPEVGDACDCGFVFDLEDFMER